MLAEEPQIQDRRALLKHVLDHVAHLLPMQGPIGVFIHHNTLHAFQHLPFEQAVIEAARLLGTEPYMSEQQFRDAIVQGRIQESDIDEILSREANTPVLRGRLELRKLRRLMLIPGVPQFDRATIAWEIEEGGLLKDASSRALFGACFARVGDGPPPRSTVPARPRDGLLAQSGLDLDEVVHPLLIRLAGAFLDQGMAYWPMPRRDEGFYRAVRDLLAPSGAVFPEHLERLGQEFRSQKQQNFDAAEAVLHCLHRLGVPGDEWERNVTAELLALPGWAGMMHRLEQEPGLAAHEHVPCRLIDFLAVRLTMTVAAVTSASGESSSMWRMPVREAEQHSVRLVESARLFSMAQLAGLSAEDLRQLDTADFHRLHEEVRSFDSLERRRILQLAYELRHQRDMLEPLWRYRQQHGVPKTPSRPSAQVFFCIDEREESTRRHLEEIAPDVETLGAAGFYGIAVDYAGIDDAHGVPLCPVVVKPQHAVRERPLPEHRHVYERRKALRALWARVARNSFVSSRTLVRGALSTAALGIFSLFPLIARVLTPRHYARFAHALNDWILPEPRTELTLMRTDETGQLATESLLLGFSTTEKADRVASVLAPAGLLERFARIVVVLGHGSTSLNNPHESAHDCGACGGRRGGPNARLFAAMANRKGVREVLRSRGISIPDDTWFVGGYHDTCNDEIEYFDLEEIPTSHAAEFEAIERRLNQARELEAHERARRFEAAPFGLSADGALRHVQERAEHLAEPRPEYGHCTNALTVVGRRSLTRGLFFDRRAFLVSYDPTVDPAGENLARVLGAVIPVCAGISLEYYFSFVDNEGYGCGTKLPHNISGLIGVMNGHASDLRTGLPWQMVEIHEPVRNLFVVETTPEIVGRVIGANALLSEFLNNRWIRLSTMDPDTGSVHVWRDGTFELQTIEAGELPNARSSRDWYDGKREHLPVARVPVAELV